MSATIAVLLLAGAAGEEEAFDDIIIRRYGGVAQNVKIVEDSWRCVRGRVRLGSGEIVIPANEVKDTEYGDAWPGLTTAKKDALQGRYTRAIGVLEKLAEKAKEKPWSLQYSLYYGGNARLERADRAQNDFEEARRLFRRLVKEVPDSRFLFEAYLGIADSYFYEQSWEEAQKACQEASKRLDEASRKVTDKRSLSEHYDRKRWLAEIRLVETLEARKKWDLAKTRYRDIAASTSRFGDLAARAKSGEGRCLVAGKEYRHAVEFFEDMIRQAEKDRQFEVLGGAYCGLGDAYFGMEDYLPAVWNYKRVTVIYFDEPQYAAKAHFRAGRSYEMLGTKEKNSLKFARRHYNKAVELFPDSPWKDEAAARLRALGGRAPAN